MQATRKQDPGGFSPRRFQLAATVACALILAGAVGAVALDPGAPLQAFPIRAVRIGGELRHVSQIDMEQAVGPHLRGGFLAVDVEAVADAALKLPWVSRVSVRRVWPDTLRIAVIEKEAVARWLGGGLVSAQGLVFRPRGPGPVADLPLLGGPPDASAQILETWRTANRALAEVCGGARELLLSARGVWRLRCANGLLIVFGEHQLARLERLARIYERLLGAQPRQVAAVDLRYSNGFAVRWRSEAARS